MDPLDLAHLKDFLAAEWGVSASDITDQQAKSNYRRRWILLLGGLPVTLGAYLVLKRLYPPSSARSLVGLVVVMSLSLSVLRLRLPRTLSPGRLMLTKKEVAEKLQASVDAISERVPFEYVRIEQRALLFGELCLAAVATVAECLWPSTSLELLIIISFYAIGMVSVGGLIPIRR